MTATFHSFYTGAEKIFKRVAVELDGEPARGENWHQELIMRMKAATARIGMWLAQSAGGAHDLTRTAG